VATDKKTDDKDLVHIGPEMAVAEADVHPAESEEFVRGTSLWRDAWRRLLRNKLAVFGLIVVGLVTIASIIGPTVIKRTFGFTPDYIPSQIRDQLSGSLTRCLVPRPRVPKWHDDQTH
jgi:hypothetical protein